MDKLQCKQDKAKTRYVTAVINANVQFSSLDDYCAAADEVSSAYEAYTKTCMEVEALNKQQTK
jgi:hypothetical protein